MNKKYFERSVLVADQDDTFRKLENQPASSSGPAP
jgi:hypothetical protein